ncbi:hypothetical protein F5Y15DRAFT_118337 [Xylariaceae sp. FL0016]|nr:hypothetical protein F5Y15DRAFT_118337 [Xylariaceae sp. FL0016]
MEGSTLAALRTKLTSSIGVLWVPPSPRNQRLRGGPLLLSWLTRASSWICSVIRDRTVAQAVRLLGRREQVVFAPGYPLGLALSQAKFALPPRSIALACHAIGSLVNQMFASFISRSVEGELSSRIAAGGWIGQRPLVILRHVLRIPCFCLWSSMKCIQMSPLGDSELVNLEI